MSITETHTDVVRQFIAALENNDRQRAGDYLTADFLFDGWTPKPLRKEAFLSMIGNLKEGLPDLSFNLRDLRELSEQLVVGTIHVTGYQTDSFILPELGLPPIPQTASHVSLPIETISFEFIDDKLMQMIITPVRGGNIQGLLRQLGIDVPIIQ